MRYISIVLSVEGSTDRAFLWPIVYRTALSLAANAVIGETANFIERGTNEGRIEDICKHAKEFDIFVIHADATRSALTRIRQTIVDAIREGVAQRCQIDEIRLIGLLTISEMESWALVSPESLAKSLGFVSWPDRLPIHWSPSQVETLADPKQTLEQVLKGLLQRPLDPMYLHETLESLGSSIPLEELSVLPSYQRFRDDLRAYLVAVNAAK